MSASQASLASSPGIPKLLTIPRELRDEIYEHAFSDALPSSTTRQNPLDRERVGYSASDPDTYYGEGANRYPKHTSLPSTHWLLRTSRQLRAEVLDSIKRLGHGKVHYKIDLALRSDKNKLYPTWVSVPVFTDRVDVLEVMLRIRDGKTRSVISVSGDKRDDDDDILIAGFMLLRRFIERGVFFLSKKKAQNITVGELLVEISAPASHPNIEENVAVIKEGGEGLELWISGENEPYEQSDDWEGTDELIRFLGKTIERVRICFNGETITLLVMKDLMERRDRSMAERRLQASFQPSDSA